jgi:CelD/BcsL family acetyltransferase involved in cellulose biosynthesis
LADLHSRRWNGRNEPGIFADPRMADWLREACLALEEAGLLRLYLMKSSAGPAAALCVFGAKGRSFYYIGGFDPDRAALGLGTLLVGHAIGEAEREGHRSFDFLRGSEPYKYRWGAVDQPSGARYLSPPAVRP